MRLNTASIVTRSRSYLGSFPRPVWLLMIATFVESMGRFMVVPYLSLYMRDAGVSLGVLGMVLGAAPVANIVFGAWGGQLSDRWGRKPVQIVGVGLSGLAMFGFAFTGANPVVLAILNFFNGMTRTFYRPATNAALADHCPPDRRSEAFALNRIALNAAFGLGPILGVAIFQIAPKAGFILGGILNLAVGIYLALVVPESAPARTGRNAAGPAPQRITAPLQALSRLIGSRKASVTSFMGAPVHPGLPGPPSQASSPDQTTSDNQTSQANRPDHAKQLDHDTRPDRAAGNPGSLAAWKEITRDSGFWIWTAGMTLNWGAYDLIQSFLPLHLRAQGIPLWTYGSILATNALICVACQLPVSRLLRTAPIAPAAGWSKLAFMTGFLGFAFLRSPVLLTAAMLVLSLGEVWGSAVQVRFIPEHARPNLLGRYMGLSMVSELGRAIVAPTAGFIMAATGGQAVFVMAAGLSIAGGLLLYLAGHAQDRRHPA
jgi:MFS family permease